MPVPDEFAHLEKLAEGGGLEPQPIERRLVFGTSPRSSAGASPSTN
jgi:hypothetical protein